MSLTRSKTLKNEFKTTTNVLRLYIVQVSNAAFVFLIRAASNSLFSDCGLVFFLFF